MRLSNPILDLAERYLRERFSYKQLVQEVDSLLAKGVSRHSFPRWLRFLFGMFVNQQARRVSRRDIIEALQIVFPPACPTPLVEAVCLICVSIVLASGQDELVRHIHFEVANILDKHYNRSSLLLAMRHYQIGRRHLDEKSPDYGRIQIAEGEVLQNLAMLGMEPIENLRKAVELCQQARQRFDEKTPDYGKALGSEGTALQGLSEFGIEPIENLRKAVSLYQQARLCFAFRSRDYGMTLGNEGHARVRLGELGIEPIENLQVAVELYQQARLCFTPQSPDYGKAQVGEGNARSVFAQFGTEHIVENLQKAVSLYQQAHLCFAPQSLGYGDAQLNEGITRMRLATLKIDTIENLRAAVELCEQAAERFETGSLRWSKAQSTQVYALWQLGKAKEAYQRLKEALKVVEGVRAQILREQERIAWMETVAGQYAGMVAICLDLANSATSPEQASGWRWEAWHWVHRGKSRALLELLANARPRLTAEDRPLWEEFERLAQELDEQERDIRWLWRWYSGEGEPTRASFQPVALARLGWLVGKRDEVKQKYEQKRQEVMQRIEGARTLQTVDVPQPQEVMRHLRELAGTDGDASRKPLLVEFFTLSEEELAVFLVPLWEETPPVLERVKVECGAVRRMAVSLLEATSSEKHAANEQFERLLGEMSALLEPWAHHLDEWQPTELVLSPHFLLNLLPLHAAIWKGKPLIEHYPVVYLPSPALAQEILKQRKPLTGEALLLGNQTTNFGKEKEEVNKVAKYLATRGIRYNIFVCEQATTDRVYAHAPEAGLVHFACHSLLEFVDFLRSGMELADRRLTAMDVMAKLELKRTALVYLGSCDSGRAVPGRTDELMALVRVFLYAGSPTVIASLWELHEGAGNTFADYFYNFWMSEGEPMAVAFQKAILRLKNRKVYSNPFCWAPFVLMGAWNAKEVTNNEQT